MLEKTSSTSNPSTKAAKREKALATMSGLVGALVLARAVELANRAAPADKAVPPSELPKIEGRPNGT